MYTGFIKIGTKSDVKDKDSFGTTFYKKILMKLIKPDAAIAYNWPGRFISLR